MATLLLIIDPQIDFCDPNRGALYVNGAEHDMSRLASAIRKLGDRIYQIAVTLDSHHLVHVAHPLYWIDADGNHPAPFTLISAEDVDSGKWRATRSADAATASQYVHSLAAGGKHVLVVWPPHCLIGSEGHAVMPELFDAIVEWEQGYRVANYFQKGSNLHTEHYSALRAEVPDPADSGTQLNESLLKLIENADRVIVGGEAGSHCVACTLLDIVDALGPESAKKIELLIDAISPVPGFEQLQTAMIESLTAQGMKVTTTVDLQA